MKKLQCEVCGSLEITKINEDTFRCTHCGCNYTLEQTRVLFGGTITAIAPDYSIRAGKLEKYNGEAVTAVIPSSVTIIGSEAFADCPGLEKVIIPDSVRIIGCNAFSGCSGLTEISLPSSVKTIEYGAFRGCSGLMRIEIPEEVTEISAHAFENCSNLRAVEIKGSVKRIEDYAFRGCVQLTEFNIPSTVSRIGISAFNGCISVKSLLIPESVYYIGEDAFYNCNGIRKIVCRSPEALPFLVKEFSPEVDINSYMKNGRCRFCGGQFRGIFTLRCGVCLKEKDYKIKKGKIIMNN